MGMWDNVFEKRWSVVFLAMYVIVMLPVEYFYTTTYAASWKGLPIFMVGWFWHTLITMVLIVVFYVQAIKREEYLEFGTEG
ncbi:MAG: hypothetical protein LBQ42_03955 [Synergistaceae bacterium]|jgi:hypothetical protein|nr:hypothetical protein [Synergistaceae bacterium]